LRIAGFLGRKASRSGVEVTGNSLMNGAESLIRTLAGNGVEVCFANPGTSEMHFVAALDRVDGMRCMLVLFEGVATGAADGYARMRDRPASTLLHLGPGLANGLSNLHNAMRAFSPVVNIIGDHASTHRHHDAPLTSDIEGAARPFCHWVRTSPDADAVADDGAAAIAAALSAPGRVASLILPGDTAWNEVRNPYPDGVARMPAIAPRARATDAEVDAAAAMLRSGEKTAIVLAGQGTRDGTLRVAGRIAEKTGAKLFHPALTSRVSGGVGRVPVTRIPYALSLAIDTFKDVRNIILIGGKAPVAFFAYPGKPSECYQPGTRIFTLARADEDIAYALDALALAVGAGTAVATSKFSIPDRPKGDITPEKLGLLIAATLPENAIVVDESVSTGRNFVALAQTAKPHDWLMPTGGSIGYAMPVAVGAAVACPDRKVICLESDGSGMYMPQSLWTMARDNLNILTLIFANRKYQILRNEMSNVGVSNVGPKASALLDIDNPVIDWVAQARTFGVEAFRAETMEDLSRRIDAGLAMKGPCLIEIVL
jgi:acetolactate synthase I/II/III large subunit